MSGAKQTDNCDFGSFFRANYSKAYFLAYSLLGDEEASRDVVSDSFEQLIVIDDAATKCNPSYLFMTVRNRSLNYLRKQHTFNKYVQAMLHTHAASTDNDVSRLEWLDLVEDIMQSIDELTPKTQEIMKACFVERKKYSEAAEAMGISKSAVKKHIMQGLSYLRKKFASDSR